MITVSNISDRLEEKIINAHPSNNGQWVFVISPKSARILDLIPSYWNGGQVIGRAGCSTFYRGRRIWIETDMPDDTIYYMPDNYNAIRELIEDTKATK